VYVGLDIVMARMYVCCRARFSVSIYMFIQIHKYIVSDSSYVCVLMGEVSWVHMHVFWVHVWYICTCM